MIALPQYIDREAWAGFVDMRKAIKKPLTDRAAKLVVYELQRIKDAGHDPNAALDQSTNHCWADVYVPKAKEIEKVQKQESAEEWQARRDAERAADDARVVAPPESVRQKLRGAIRRVA